MTLQKLSSFEKTGSFLIDLFIKVRGMWENVANSVQLAKSVHHGWCFVPTDGRRWNWIGQRGWT